MNEIKLIDDHIFNNADPAQALLFEAKRLLDPNLAQQVTWQKKAHDMIFQYSRKKLKAEISSVHDKLFTKPAHWRFKHQILSLFYKR